MGSDWGDLSVVGHFNRLCREPVDAPGSLEVFKERLDVALSNL